MPLIHKGSKKAFVQNVQSEMEANPGPSNRAQNLAIAYNIKRKASGKKKMAQGGEVTISATDEPRASVDSHNRAEMEMESPRASQVENPSLHESMLSTEEEDHADSIADAILDKLREQKLIKSYADGGEVDLEDNAREDRNLEDDLSFNALRKENYSEEDALEDQPLDSNEHSPEHDEEDVNDGSIISEIRKRMKMKRL